jgi:hypothetical protein
LCGQGFSPASRRLGVLSGFVFQRRSPADTTLASVGTPNPFFKVGIVSLQIGLQIGRESKSGGCGEARRSVAPPSVPFHCCVQHLAFVPAVLPPICRQARPSVPFFESQSCGGILLKGSESTWASPEQRLEKGEPEIL